MRTKPFLAGIFLATLAMIPILIFTRTVPEETRTDRPSSDSAVGSIPQDDGLWTEPTGSNGDQETPSAELIAGMGAKQIALALRVVVLQGGDPAELLLAAGDEEAEAIRAYLALIRDESDLRLFAKLTQSLGSLSDPEGDILSYCQKELVADDRPIVKLILAEILEGRPDEASIVPLRQVLNQYWDSENPEEGRGVMRSALRGLGKIDSEAARQEIWRRFRAAPSDELRTEALEALALRADEGVIERIQDVIGDSGLPEEVRLGAVRALASSFEGRPTLAATTLIGVYRGTQDAGIRGELIRSAAQTGARRGLDFVQERLADPGESEALHVAAILSLHHYGNRGSLGVLMQIENRSGNPRLSSLARQAAAAIRQRSGEE